MAENGAERAEILKIRHMGPKRHCFGGSEACF